MPDFLKPGAVIQPVAKLAERGGFEPYSPPLAKSLNNVDLVDC